MNYSYTLKYLERPFNGNKVSQKNTPQAENKEYFNRFEIFWCI